MQLAGGLALSGCSQGSAGPGAPVSPQVGLRPNVSHHLLPVQLIKSQTPSQVRGHISIPGVGVEEGSGTSKPAGGWARLPSPLSPPEEGEASGDVFLYSEH